MRGSLPGSGICYAVDGEGPPLLLLHAFPLGLVMWERQVSALASICRFIRFDDRGFGGSPPTDSVLTMDRVADDAADLLDHLGHETAVVGGCSMGGYASFAFARRHPKRLKGLVLVDTRAGADSEEGRERRRVVAKAVLEQGPSPVVDAFLPGLVGKTSHAERLELVAWLEKVIRSNPGAGIASALLGMGEREDSNPTLATIRVPTLIVCGTEDVLTPPSEARKMNEGIAGSELVLMERAGHLPNLEDPARFNEILGGFLRRIP